MKKIAGKNQQLTMRCQTTLNEAVHLMPIIKNTRRRHGKGKTKRRFFSLARCNVACACRYCGRPTIYRKSLSLFLPPLSSDTQLVRWRRRHDLRRCRRLFRRYASHATLGARHHPQHGCFFADASGGARGFWLFGHPAGSRQWRSLINRCRGEVSFNGITMRYATTKKAALTDVFLTIAPGETVALVGKSAPVRQHWPTCCAFL